MGESGNPQMIRLREPLRVLTPGQISQIDRYLDDLEEFGRVTLVKRKGRLRFIEKTESVEAMHAEAEIT
jgi:hypothetical protein